MTARDVKDVVGTGNVKDVKDAQSVRNVNWVAATNHVEVLDVKVKDF